MATDNIGALWKPRTDNPKAPPMKGTIEISGQKVSIVIWPNRYKEQDIAHGKEGAERKPDYFIQLDKPMEKARSEVNPRKQVRNIDNDTKCEVDRQ